MYAAVVRHYYDKPYLLTVHKFSDKETISELKSKLDSEEYIINGVTFPAKILPLTNEYSLESIHRDKIEAFIDSCFKLHGHNRKGSRTRAINKLNEENKLINRYDNFNSVFTDGYVVHTALTVEAFKRIFNNDESDYSIIKFAISNQSDVDAAISKLNEIKQSFKN